MQLRARALIVAIGIWIVGGGIAPKHLTVAAEGIDATPRLTDLKSVDELKGLFNQDRGKPRLVLLLSPT